MKKRSGRSGVALATVILVFATTAVIGTAILGVAVSEIRSAAVSENSTAAYYLARSAVDAVSAQAEKRISLLNLTYQSILSAEPSERADRIEEYALVKEQLDALNILPKSLADECSAEVDGICAQPLTVSLRLTEYSGETWLEASCTAYSNGSSGTASKLVSKVSFPSVSVEVSGNPVTDFEWYSDAIYAWGNIDAGKNFNMLNNGSMSAGGTISISGDNYHPNVARDMPILRVDSEYLNKIRTKSLVNGKNRVTITPADSGYYGALSVTTNKEMINWYVDTSSADVTLIFDSILAAGNNNISINVTGPHNLYIYIVENGERLRKGETIAQLESNDLFYVKNSLDITGSYDGKSLTYIIVYNDTQQKYFAETGSTRIPADLVQAEPLDTVVIKNSNSGGLHAYLYLPYCNISFNNNTDIYGVIFASNFTVDVNTIITFIPMPRSDLFDKFEIIDQTDVISYTSFVRYDCDYSSQIWLR